MRKFMLWWFRSTVEQELFLKEMLKEIRYKLRVHYIDLIFCYLRITQESINCYTFEQLLQNTDGASESIQIIMQIRRVLRLLDWKDGFSGWQIAKYLNVKVKNSLIA